MLIGCAPVSKLVFTFSRMRGDKFENLSITLVLFIARYFKYQVGLSLETKKMNDEERNLKEISTHEKPKPKWTPALKTSMWANFQVPEAKEYISLPNPCSVSPLARNIANQQESWKVVGSSALKESEEEIRPRERASSLAHDLDFANLNIHASKMADIREEEWDAFGEKWSALNGQDFPYGRSRSKSHSSDSYAEMFRVTENSEAWVPFNKPKESLDTKPENEKVIESVKPRADERVRTFTEPRPKSVHLESAAAHNKIHQTNRNDILYLVEFKSNRTELFFNPNSFSVKIGDIVIVEADRGDDLGKIVASLTPAKLQMLLTDQEPKDTIPKKIIRLAKSQDLAGMDAKLHDESMALVRCAARVRQKKLPMEVVDAEYQWDRNKLTFFFSADKRIDFRELVRDLFRIYKTRIWMCAIEKSGTMNSVRDALLEE